MSYCVVVFGDTTTDPTVEVADAQFIEQYDVFVEFHERVELLPKLIELGLAVRVTLGTCTGGFVTVMVAELDTVLLPFVHCIA